MQASPRQQTAAAHTCGVRLRAARARHAAAAGARTFMDVILLESCTFAPLLPAASAAPPSAGTARFASASPPFFPFNPAPKILRSALPMLLAFRPWATNSVRGPTSKWAATLLERGG